MTDEQYIDWLFNEEPCDTPGFRDFFLLELMATIGERPRAGDVAQMHLAFCAGREAPPDWTTDRPTEPGEYWVSIEPDKRKGRINFPSVIPCEVSLCANSYLMDIGSLNIGSDKNGTTLAARYITGGQWVPLSNEWYDGAKWSRRETPADPFQEVVK